MKKLKIIQQFQDLCWFTNNSGNKVSVLHTPKQVYIDDDSLVREVTLATYLKHNKMASNELVALYECIQSSQKISEIEQMEEDMELMYSYTGN